MKPLLRHYMVGARYSMLAWSIPLAIAVGFGLGWWADRRWGTEPWLQVVGFLLGAASGLAQLLQVGSDDER